MKRTSSSLIALLTAGLFSSANAADFFLVNLDPPGSGLNDPTPAAPLPDNPGTTIGEQRVNVYLAALDIWADTLESAVPIFVGATFQPLNCSATGGVLGAAGTTFIFRDFPGSEDKPMTWHHSALADAIVGEDLAPGEIDVISFFNSDIDDNPDCLTGTTWYYGLDGNNAPNEFDFLAVVTHEINHGIGHANFANEETGALQSGLPDVYTDFSFDNTIRKTWSNMTDEERQFSAINDLNLVWIGPAVSTRAKRELGPRPSVDVDGEDFEGVFEAQAASFGPELRRRGRERELALVNDSVDPATDACEPITDPDARKALRRKIALIDRGGCSFVQKVLNAQEAGAKGAIIANNAPKGLTPMGGASDEVTIPSVGVTQAAGDILKAELALDDDDVEVRLFLDRRSRAGTDRFGRVRLYAVDPVRLGSSVSHWDVTATPNLLMEPSITDSLNAAETIDLSPALLQDIGWELTHPIRIRNFGGIF